MNSPAQPSVSELQVVDNSMQQMKVLKHEITDQEAFKYIFSAYAFALIVLGVLLAKSLFLCKK